MIIFYSMLTPVEGSAAVINIPFRYMRSNQDTPQCTNSVCADPSPRNASASCISAITFDGSEQSIKILPNAGTSGLSLASGSISHLSRKYSEIKEDCQYSSTRHEILVNREEDKCEDIVSTFFTSKDEECPLSRGCSEEAESNFAHLTSQRNFGTADIIKGSLYSRIMNANGFHDAECKHGTKQNHSIIDDDENSAKEDQIGGRADHRKVEEAYMDSDDDGDNYTRDGFDEYCDSTLTIEKYELKDKDSTDKVQLDCFETHNADPCVRIATTIEDEKSVCRKGNNIIDQWRQVQNTQTGKVYYYNRRTRESRWSLPDNAVLLRKKRQIGYEVDGSMDDDERTVVVSLTSPEVSSLTENITLGAEKVSTTAVACQSFKLLPTESGMSFNSNTEVVEDILEKTINPSSTCTLSDEKIDPFQLDEESSQLILERCKKLQKSISFDQKRRFFFPDDSDYIEHKTKWETTENPLDKKTDPPRNGSLKSRRNDTPGTSLHCMFCGVGICTTGDNNRDEIVVALKKHLQLKCFSFSKFAVDSTCEHGKVRSALKEVWSTTSCFQACRERLKENTPPTGRNLKIKTPLSVKQISNIVEKPDSKNVVEPDSGIFTLSDDEDTMLTYEPRNQSLSNRIHRKSDHGRAPVHDEVRSSCPFCRKEFQSGSKLSMHLLKCRERQKSSKKRGQSSSMLHSRLLTVGGRHLPGHPRVPHI